MKQSKILRQASEAFRRGDKETCRKLLRQVLQANPHSEIGWMWMSLAVDGIEEKQNCLREVLEINPNNKRAQEMLRQLSASRLRQTFTNLLEVWFPNGQQVQDKWIRIRSLVIVIIVLALMCFLCLWISPDASVF